MKGPKNQDAERKLEFHFEFGNFWGFLHVII